MYFLTVNVYHNLGKRTRQDITSHTFKVVSNSGMLVLLFRGSSGTGTHNMSMLVNKAMF